MFYAKKWRSRFNFSVLAFAFILFAISFSKFKMPHYIIMLLPLAALFTAPYLRQVVSYSKGIRLFYPIQFCLCLLVVLITLLLNFYYFPPRNLMVWVIGGFLLIALLAFAFRTASNKPEKLFFLTVAFSMVFNFFMNYNFFPSLLEYQGGNQLAAEIDKKHLVIPDSEIVSIDPNAHSFDFARKHNHPVVGVEKFASAYPSMPDKYFLLSSNHLSQLTAEGFEVKPVASVVDYNVTTLKFNFLNPATRAAALDTLMLAKIYKH